MSMKVASGFSRTHHQHTTTEKRTQDTVRQDLMALWGGIGASLFFTALIWWLGPRLEPFRATLLPDSGADWYYWRLPVETWAAKLSAWGFYFIHQLAIWGLIYVAQRSKARYTTNLHWFNYAALGVNALFGFVHVVQTQLWYDSLAQDVSIWSSQWSVIIDRKSVV